MTQITPSQMVFTLQEDDAPAIQPQPESDWERNLNALRNRQYEMQQNNNPIFAFTPPTHADRPKNHQEKPPVRQFGDSELDAAYREYLQRCEAEHNARLQNVAEEDVAILIQEDWIAPQDALKSERNRQNLTELQTIVLKQNNQNSETVVEDLFADAPAEEKRVSLPEIAIHVYQPTTQMQRRLKVVSEQELIENIREKLKPHLSNALAGLVRQTIQKKLAMISYDLQIALNDETPKIVDEVLAHNLETILRTVKFKLREKEYANEKN